MRRLLLLTAAIFLCTHAFANRPTQVLVDRTLDSQPDAEVAEHRMASRRYVRLESGYPTWDGSAVRLKLVVGPDGSVRSARIVEGWPHLYTTAADGSKKKKRRDKQYDDLVLRAAQAWKYRPFLRNSKAVTVTFTEDVDVLPPEQRPVERVAFPQIKDWNSLRITLSRGGDAFHYWGGKEFVIYGNGTVQYKDGLCRVLEGEITINAVRALVDDFRAADYFWLFPEYPHPHRDIVDAGTVFTSVEFDENKMSVYRTDGPTIDEMPVAVEDLELAIERVADPKRWVKTVKTETDTECEQSLEELWKSVLPYLSTDLFKQTKKAKKK
jgi:hypothetical protein